MPQTIFVSATPQKYEQDTPIRWPSSWWPTGLVDPVAYAARWRHRWDDLLAGMRAQTKASVCWSPRSPSAWPRTLTDYLNENGLKARYLHSDIDTVERSRSSAICGWASSMCWSASTCCARGWILGGVTGRRFSMPTRKASCAPSAA